MLSDFHVLSLELDSNGFRLGVNINRLATAAVSRLQGELAKEGREPASTAFKKLQGNIFPEKNNKSKSPERETGQDLYYLLFHGVSG